jgi:hypothetical protein
MYRWFLFGGLNAIVNAFEIQTRDLKSKEIIFDNA